MFFVTSHMFVSGKNLFHLCDTVFLIPKLELSHEVTPRPTNIDHSCERAAVFAQYLLQSVVLAQLCTSSHMMPGNRPNNTGSRGSSSPRDLRYRMVVENHRHGKPLGVYIPVCARAAIEYFNYNRHASACCSHSIPVSSAYKP